MNPYGTLLDRSGKQPDSIAFVAGDDMWSYRRLATKVDEVARALRGRGIGTGDRVVLHMANIPELVIAYYACFRIGAVACPLNIRLKTAEVQLLLRRLQPALYIGQAQLYLQIAAVWQDVPAPYACFVVGSACPESGARPWEDLFNQSSVYPGVDAGNADADMPAVLLTTSGTTGEPKFVVHTSATLTAIADSFLHLGLDERHVAVVALPMMHVGGLATLLGCGRFGIPAMLFERFEPEAVLDAIGPHRCSWLIGVPSMYAAIVASQKMRPRQARTLRFCLVAGDVCPPQLQQEFADMFGAPLRSFWGSTETFGTFTFGLQPGPVSRPTPTTQFLLIDDRGEAVPHGSIGELLVRGPSVAAGYWSGPGRVAGWPDGWFHTGDLMREGENHDFWFVSRKKDLIIRGGSNISPHEVEGVLKMHPAVRDAAVVGIADAILGQRVAGFVELAAGSEEAVLDDIAGHAKSLLADYKVPECLQVIKEVARNGLGKIDRKSLLAMVRP